MSLYTFFNIGTCPNGWDSLDVADGKLIYLADNNLGDADGTDSVDHNHTLNGCVCDYSGANSYSNLNPKSLDLMPDRVKIKLCKMPLNFYNLYPQNAVLLSDDDCPDGYTAEDSHVGKFVVITNIDDDAGDSVAEDKGNHRHFNTCNRYRPGTDQKKVQSCYSSFNNLIDDWEDLSHIKLRFCKKD